MEELQEEIEDQQINEDYKIWKKNTAFLYDYLLTHALVWPSLTIEWLPVHEIPQDADYSVEKLIIGTHASPTEQNSLMIAQVKLPLASAETKREYDDSGKEAAGLGFAGKEHFLKIELEIPHQGEVNRARYMPQHYSVIATKTTSGEVHIFDYTKHQSKDPTQDQSKPELRLLGKSHILCI